MVPTASPTLMAADICRMVMIIDVNTPNRAGLMAICVPKDSKLSAFAMSHQPAVIGLTRIPGYALQRLPANQRLDPP